MQTAFKGHLAPAYSYEFLNDPYGPKLDIPTYHYADCTCPDCASLHFPCEDWSCEYCYNVRMIIDSSTRAYQHGKRVSLEYGQIINYSAWLESDKPDMDSMLWAMCDGCGILITDTVYDDHDHYCSEQCKEDHYEPEIFYCDTCGDTEVDGEYDTCRYCKEDERHDYDDESDDGSGYEIAERIGVSDYKYVKNCWIDPSGYVRYVPYCNHDTTAHRMGFNGTSACENAGYCHISIYWDESRQFVYIPDRPTKEQIATIRIWAKVKDLDLPDCAKHVDDVLEERSYVWTPFTVLQSCLPRSMRDMFFPLSGD